MLQVIMQKHSVSMEYQIFGVFKKIIYQDKKMSSEKKAEINIFLLKEKKDTTLRHARYLKIEYAYSIKGKVKHFFLKRIVSFVAI